MNDERQCQTCGKSIDGRIDRQFCSDKCRKYYKRHGETGYSGIIRIKKTDLSGEGRTSTGGGSNSVGNYLMKRIVDFGAKAAENRFLTSSNLGTNFKKSQNIPLQVRSAEMNLGLSVFKLSPTMQLSPDFSDFLGKKLSFPFKMLIYGLPGSGKSTFCMHLANQIASFHRLLYVSGEELMDSDTLLDKQRRTILPPNRKNCDFINRLPANELEWKGLLLDKSQQFLSLNTIFYDSVTKLEITPFYVDAVANDCKMPAFSSKISHVFITHAHKDGQMYRGDGSWAHEVDILIKCEKGIATTEKNRFEEIGRQFKIY